MGIPCYVIFSKQSGYLFIYLFIYLFLYLSKFIPESHIGGSSADIADWVLRRWPFKIRCLICSGVAVTFFKDRKTMLVGCIGSQIGRASVGRRTGVDRWFFKSADSLKLAGNLLIMGHTSVYFEGHHAMVCPFQSVDRCPADAHDVRAGTARLPVGASKIEKIGRASENF